MENKITFDTQTYADRFWAGMRGTSGCFAVLAPSKTCPTECYALPIADSDKLNAQLCKKSLFRKIATVKSLLGTGYNIQMYDSDAVVRWIDEEHGIPIEEAKNDFSIREITAHKLGVAVKVNEEFVHDQYFGLEKYIVETLSKNFSRAETDAFINGNGAADVQPIGILCDDGGAEIGAETQPAILDHRILAQLYFSVKPEYRENGVWLMNDGTAYALRTLQDSSGRYIYDTESNTLLGKPVYISEFMPDIGAGNKPIAFGDFSYYWIFQRKIIGIKPITEVYVNLGQVGYLAIERLDGRLIRTDAVKVLKITPPATE